MANHLCRCAHHLCICALPDVLPLDHEPLSCHPLLPLAPLSLPLCARPPLGAACGRYGEILACCVAGCKACRTLAAAPSAHEMLLMAGCSVAGPVLRQAHRSVLPGGSHPPPEPAATLPTMCRRPTRCVSTLCRPAGRCHPPARHTSCPSTAPQPAPRRMFTIPSLRARECTDREKDALNLLFLAVPLLNVALPFVW